MRRSAWIPFVLSLMAVLPMPALAATHAAGGIGFRDSSAPLAVRWWLGGAQRVAIDVGAGFSSQKVESGSDSKRLFDYAVDVGVPILAKSWEQAHLLLRPGILVASEEAARYNLQSGRITGSDRGSLVLLSLELEAEVFLVKNVSISAAHGIGVVNDKRLGQERPASFGSFGENFTSLGFHVYLFGE